MADYKSNSHKHKETREDSTSEKKVKKVVSGEVKKKNEIQKFKNVFISEDVRDVKSYLLLDVVIPAVKDVIEDIITKGIRMMLRGDSSSTRSSSSSSKVSYRGYYDDKEDSSRRGSTVRTTIGYSYNDITLHTRGDAEEVLDEMGELISKYGMVSVADLYDLVGITGEYTDNKYGWTNIRSATPVRTRDGYMLKLPRALPFK